VRWKGKISAGTVSDRVTGFEDWMPTLADLAGRGRVPDGIDGISFEPTLLGTTQHDRPFLYREFPAYEGQQSIRVGDWKAVRQKLMPRGKAVPIVKTELYNLKDDIAETRDVSALNPKIVAKLEELMHGHRSISKEFPFPVLDNAVQ
jgi:arylsulfatase A